MEPMSNKKRKLLGLDKEEPPIAKPGVPVHVLEDPTPIDYPAPGFWNWIIRRLD